MDCLQASEIVTAALDGELLDADALGRAREHCAACPRCRAIERLGHRVQQAGATQAPSELVAKLEDLGTAQAMRVRQVVERQDFGIIAAEPAAARGAWEWTPRFTAFASAAAVVLISLAAGSVALLGAGDKAADTAAELMLADDDMPAPSAGPESMMAEDATGMRATEQPAAPPYVVHDGIVHVMTGVPAPSALATAGTVTTDLGTGTTGSHAAFTAGAGGPVFVRDAGGTYLAFAPVVRGFGRAAYALVSDVPIARFGQWPSLPTGMAGPQSPDGAPVFMRFGFDDLGVDVYAPTPGGIDGGFAIAPGTAAGDPAAGNPNWTWWERVR
ncbi:MAG: zf-HC2 domain-containing protein [Coriobacteriia bacterium]